MKKCSTCQHTKELSYFHRRSSSRDGHVGICKECHKVVNALHYQGNKAAYIGRSVVQTRKKQVAFQAWKATQSCKVCGESCTACLDFHHIDPSKKEGALSEMVTNFGSDRWYTEVEKCVVLCSNCHRKVHANVITLGP